MKVIRVVGLLAVLSMLLVAAPASAAGPAGSWATGIACQNMGNAEALLSISFYAEGSGTPVLTYTDSKTVPVNGSRGYYTPSSFPDLPASFLGSGVVSSDQPLACNVNTQTTGVGASANPYRMATAGAVSEENGSPTVYVPQVMKALSTWNSYIAVQNTSMAAVTVNVHYKDRNGNDVAGTTDTNVNIPGQSNKVFYQADNPDLPSGFLGSAIVSAADGTTKLAVLVNLYNDGSSPTNAQLMSYNGVGTGTAKLYVPRFVRNYFGYQGGITVQNVGQNPTPVRIVFHFDGQPFTFNSTSNLAPGASLALYAPNIAELAGVDAMAESKRFGSAEIDDNGAGTGSLIAIVNEDNRGGPGVPAERAGQGGTYNAIPNNAPSNTLLFPQFTRLAGGIFTGGFQVANTTGTAGSCTLTYASTPQVQETNVPLPANGVIGRYGLNVAGLPDGFNSSVTVACNQPVIGIANLSVSLGSGRVGDSSTVTTGVNK